MQTIDSEAPVCHIRNYTKCNFRVPFCVKNYSNKKKWHDGEYGLPYSSVKKTLCNRIEKHISESSLHKN